MGKHSGRHSAGGRRRLADTVDRSTQLSDAQLLLVSPRLRLWCTFVVVGLFGAYFGLLVALNWWSDWALYLIAPATLSGIAVGALLERAAKRRESAHAAELTQL